MEDLKKKNGMDNNDKEIVFSKAVKAGKRIYYLDVKKNRKEEMFLAITESKKIISGEGEETSVSFEKHKIFLYQEDFEKFLTGLEQAIRFIETNTPIADATTRKEEEEEEETTINDTDEDKLDEIKIQIDFE